VTEPLMRLFVLGGEKVDLAAIQSAIRLGEVEIVVSPDSGFPGAANGRYRFAGWMLDTLTRELTDPAGRPVHLTSSEYALLMAFLRHPGEALARSTIASVLRGRECAYFDRSIDTLVARLRKKIDGNAGSRLIRSARGVGYVFCAAVSKLPPAPGATAA